MVKKTAILFVLTFVLTGMLWAQQKAPDSPLQVGNDTVQLSHFRGKKVMLWFFSTWCPSCQAGLQALAQKEQTLEKQGLHVIAVRNYKNGGYPGPSITDFVKKVTPSLLKAKNWTLAEATKELAGKYNSRGYPDIYYLINSDGEVVKVDSSPGANMDEILAFARSK